MCYLLFPISLQLDDSHTKALVQVFISCRLDYCNSLLYGISGGLLCCLQLVQNVAAQMVTGARRCDHISPLLRQLNLASRPSASHFQGSGLVHQSLAGVTSSYLADDCRLLSDLSWRSLRSSATDFRTLVVPQTHNKFNDRSFSAAGPRQWNNLQLNYGGWTCLFRCSDRN